MWKNAAHSVWQQGWSKAPGEEPEMSRQGGGPGGAMLAGSGPAIPPGPGGQEGPCGTGSGIGAGAAAGGSDCARAAPAWTSPPATSAAPIHHLLMSAFPQQF